MAAIHRHRLLQPSLGRQQIDGAAAVVVAREQALLLQIGDVLVHRGQRIQLHAFANFLERGRISVLLHELGNEVVDLALPSGDGHGQLLANIKRMSRQTKVECTAAALMVSKKLPGEI